MEPGNKIVVVGSCMMDFVSYAPSLPKSGETIHGSTFVTNFGGKGANQCVAAAKLGGRTTLIAKVGADQHGENYIKNLNTFNVDTTHITKSLKQSTGIAQIIVSEQGANQIVIVSGANKELCSSDLEACRSEIESAVVLVCQLETCIEVALTAMKICKGISILNGAPSLKKYPQELLKLPSIFCVNESEAEDFAGVAIKSIEDGKVAIGTLLKKGCQSVILTMGALGVLYARSINPEKIIHTPCPKVNCIDSTGAGDSFIGTLAFLLSSNKWGDAENCIRISCHIASDSVTRQGTQISFPTADILHKF